MTPLSRVASLNVMPRPLGWLLPLALLALSLQACKREETIEQHEPPPASVVVATVDEGRLQREFRVSGVVRSVARAQLAFQTDGVVLERLVDLGDVVEPGQLLAVIRNPRLAPEESAALATVSEIRARRDQAQRDLERLRQLRVDKAVGEEQVEQKAADLSALNASLQRAQAQLEALSGLANEASLYAPFAGEVSQVLAEPGEYVRPGQVVLALGDPEALELAVKVPAQYADLELGDDVTVEVPLLGQRFTAVVDQISHQGEAGTGLFPLVLRLNKLAGLRVGLRADAMVPWESPVESLLVPLTSVVDPVGGLPRVFRLNGNQVEQVAVSLGHHRGNQVAVAVTDARLHAGDQVVISGHQSLIDGQSVRVLQ